MSSRRRVTGFVALLFVGALFAFTPQAWAAEEGEDDGKGTVRIQLSHPWGIPYVKGERWEEHEFEKGGKMLILEGIDRDAEMSIELKPVDGGIGPATATVNSRCWKLKKIKRGVKAWYCDLKVKFPTVKVDEPAPEPEKVEPEEDDDIPPMPGVPPPPKKKDE